MTYKLGQKSLLLLQDVHQDLRDVVELAITLTTVDFRVQEGLRSKARQQELYDTKKSRTLNSRHLAGPDGLSRAVDLTALVGGKVTWDLMKYLLIAEAMASAAKRLKVQVVFGGCWDKPVNMFTQSVGAEVAEYQKRFRELVRLGKIHKDREPFVDAVHFELDRTIYG